MSLEDFVRGQPGLKVETVLAEALVSAPEHGGRNAITNRYVKSLDLAREEFVLSRGGVRVVGRHTFLASVVPRSTSSDVRGVAEEPSCTRHRVVR